ncbi:Cu/Zn superoxide dismutase [Geodermatophilus pulveris]|uniref:Cu/Zn superoxide dismutase n=1 Tax=Geodermatophilus pulveris TaxID=1564159 RepID=A0A239CEI0_9ACTN|nr:superoxide dismutase family protein [Geodermatophilus pulveris]SNS18646.1 Cu/Zn superoxide dismutase [Geodermatophilus pulveris]
MRRTLLPAAAVLLALTACTTDDGQEQLRSDLAEVTAEEEPESPVLEPAEATTELVDPEGSVLGGATVSTVEQGTEVTVDVAGLTPGFHPMGLYAVGDCTPGDAAAGAPFPSVGELLAVLPPVLVLDDGVGSLTALVESTPALEELVVADGSALVLQEAVPDLAAVEPTGSALACGAFSG